LKIWLERTIIAAMQTPSPSTPPPIAGLAVVALLAAGLLAAIAGWSMFGTSILFTYAENGLAWCF